MLDDRRHLLWAVVGHLLAATPFLAATWYLFASTAGDANGGDKRLLGLACGVAAGIIIARPLGAVIAEPMSAIFFPRAGVRPTPAYSLADAQRKRGQFDRAMKEYERITAEFPDALRAYVAMMEIAVKDLGDAERARAVLMQGLAASPNERMRMELLRVHRVLGNGGFKDLDFGHLEGHAPSCPAGRGGGADSAAPSTRDHLPASPTVSQAVLLDVIAFEHATDVGRDKVPVSTLLGGVSL